MAKTKEECFTELIKQRSWYKNSGMTPSAAAHAKAKFLQGTLSNAQIEFYLKSSGYKMVQKELWDKENK